MIELMLTNLAVILSLMTLVWLVSIRLRDVSIIDIFWGLGFVLIAWVTLAMAKRETAGQLLLPVLTTMWGSRLASHLAVRNLGHPEDQRYAAMRRNNPDTFWWRSYLTIFLLQGAIMWVVSTPLQVGIWHSVDDWNAWKVIGLIVWLVGFFFEAVGDWQLARFKRKPENKGKVLQSGLWRFTRHPNYFGDFLVWWGFYLICIATGHGIWTIVSPLAMSVLLIAISGVSLTEKVMLEKRPGYREYVEQTNRFFPGPRKRHSI